MKNQEKRVDTDPSTGAGPRQSTNGHQARHSALRSGVKVEAGHNKRSQRWAGGRMPRINDDES